MAEERRNWLGPYIPQGSFFRELLQQMKLAYSLLLDQRVPPLAKLIPVAALIYLVSPVDIAPDVLLGLGQLDDAAVVLLGLRMFFEFSPPEVVHEHLKRLAHEARNTWRVVDDEPPAARSEAGDDVIDGQ